MKYKLNNFLHPSTELSVARGCGFILLTLFTLLLIPIVSADVQTVGPFKTGDEIVLTQISNSNYCNISSVSYPNSSYAVQNVEMTKNGVNFNYTLKGKTWPTGRYIVNGDCDTTVWAYDFHINPSGLTQASILENPIQIMLFFLAALIVGVAMYASNNYLGFIGAIIFLLNGIYVLIYGFNNYTDLYTQSVGMVLIGIGFIVMFISAYEYVAGGDE